MSTAGQHTTETHARREATRPLMPAMPAGPDYWPVPAQRTPGPRAGDRSVAADGAPPVASP